METRKEQKERRRWQILRAALDLFVRRGYAETTIGQIAEAASMSTGLMFHYFSSKEDLYLALVAIGVEGTKAPQAAGKIHTDIERGFIRAEVIAYEDMMKCGSVAAAKEKGLLRSEGKEYVVQDGDMVYFRFNV